MDENGKTVKNTIKPTIEYYIPDLSGESETKDIWGTPVKKQVSRNVYTLNKTLEQGGVKTCEAKLNQELKFLQKEYGDKELTYDMDDFQLCTIDIELANGDNPKPFNEMVEDCDTVINLITVHFSKDDTVYTFGNKEYTGDSDSVGVYHYIPDEALLLEKFIKLFRRKHVDIVTGWNCKFFDFRYIIERCEKLEVDVSLSPLNYYIKSYERDGFGNKTLYYKIPGISILDGKDLYQNFTFTKEVSYKLNFIGHKVTGEGKLDLDDSINKIYETNWNQFVEYNIQDVMLVKAINDKKQFLELAINLCYQALIPFESIFSSIQVITGYIVRYLHKFGLVMPDIELTDKEPYPGAYVKGLRGIYKYLVSFDFESLYPTIMRMFNISPETLVLNPTKEQLETMDLIKTPASKTYKCTTPKGPFEVDGIYYRKDKKGIVPQIVETIFNERKYFKNKMKVAKGYEKNLTPERISKDTHMDLDLVKTLYGEVKEEGYSSSYYNSQQQVRKILINSIYGVLGNQHFAFYNIKNAMAITIGGRDIIQYVSNSVNDYFRKYWHKVAYKYFPEFEGVDIEPITGDLIPVIDTDSNYICLDEVITKMGLTFETDEDFRVWVDKFDQVFFTPFFKKILDIYAKKYNADNIHNFKREKIVTHKLVSQKKRYADMVIEDEGDVFDSPQLKITGLDIVKSSTPTYCRKHLKSALTFMLTNHDRDKTGDMLREIHSGFLKAPIEDISSPRRVNNYTKYAESLEFYAEKGLRIRKGTPQHVKSSIYYNYFINKKKLMYPYIENGSDIKYIYIRPNNSLRAETISYAGSYPKEFRDNFRVDYKKQWEKTFGNIIEDFYDVFGWGKVVLERENLSDFIKF